MKNKWKAIIGILLTVAVFFSAFALQASADKSLKIRQIDSNLPTVTFELEGKCEAEDITSIKVGSETLQVSQAKPGKEADSRLVYILVDTSTSMSQSALDALKPHLIAYADSLTKSDRLVLMTFGEKVNTLLKGGESKSKVHKTINAIQCNSEGTAFYGAILKATKDAKGKNDFERKYVIVVSDGADFEKGNSSQQEVVDAIETNTLPFYGLCLSSTEKSSADGFGYITRASGGELIKFAATNAGAKFGSLKKTINNVTIIRSEAKINKSLGKCELSVKAEKGDKRYAASDLTNALAKADSEAPEVNEITYEKQTNSFRITFSEGVEKADNLSSYTVKKGDKELTILSAKYFEDEKYVQLNMDETVYSGEYTFEFKNITDNSDNENALKTDSLTKDIEATPIILNVLKIGGFALIPVAFLLALYIILLSLKKKKKVEKIKDIFVVQEEVVENEHVRIEQKQGRKIRIHIQAGDGTVHDMEYNLVNSMIVGRSGICDLAISDPNLSRQHFVVEDVENGLAVTDLETTNGTFINGIQIQSRTFLDNHSTISAGNSIIKIIY